MTKHWDPRLNLDQALFGWCEREFPRQQKAGNGLKVPAAQEPSRPELKSLDACSRGCTHDLILVQVFEPEGWLGLLCGLREIIRDLCG
jgi:hypothetical protein